MCWSALLGALTPMLTKAHSIDSDLTSSNLVLSNTISEKLIETHELVFQCLKLVFRLAVIVGTKERKKKFFFCLIKYILKDYQIMHVMFFIVWLVQLNKVGLWIIKERFLQNIIVFIILM
jgi:hypothetical protein